MKKDNKGMTLIELLVAVTMLAVVVSPFLNTFVMSARQNNKARETFRATTVAQNLMEGLEAFSLEDVCTQVNNNVADSKLYMPNGYIGHMELENSAGEKSGEIVDGVYRFKNTDSNRYELGIQGIEEDGKKYDAKILFDASGYPAFNESVEIEVDVMNEATDVIFYLDQQDETSVLGADVDWSNIKRTININVDKENGNVPKSTRKVTIQVTYVNTSNGAVIGGKTLSRVLGNLKNIYIFYYPNYHSKAASVKDYFDIRFEKESFFNLNIVKQKYKAPYSGTDSTYVANLHVKDTNNMSQGRVARITLRTNIPEDLYGNGGPYENALNCSYKYAGDQDADEVERLLNFNGNLPQTLGKKISTTNVMYETTVQVFPEGTYPNQYDTTSPLAELSNKTR